MNGGMVYTLNNLKTMSKQTAVEWLIDQLEKYELYSKVSFQCLKEIEQAKAMEKEQMERMFSKEEVIAIVRKSIATGLTAEYLILALKGGDK
jgi:hypothetical protein